jgi:cobaltochelatase CobT
MPATATTNAAHSIFCSKSTTRPSNRLQPRGLAKVECSTRRSTATVSTRAYDREVSAASLVRPALLVEYREQLDRGIAALGLNVTRLARDLKALLATPIQDGWDGAQEEGLIDGRRLAQLISTPNERRLFRTNRLQPVADCLVTFLIDCSGSMRQHMGAVAPMIDVFARALEMAGVSNEVLGFTTGAWNGGRAQHDWQRAGRPEHPGRLNEVCRVRFKTADTSWRRARPDIAALLRPEMFREGIDGEAIEWACQRIDGRAEFHTEIRTDARRILLVVSDGSPMDSATHRANDPHYLDHHLRDVVQRQEQLGQIAVYGIGVGLDLSPYYRHSVALDLSTPPTTRTFYEILSMIAGGGRR